MPHAIRRISGAKIVIFFQTAMTQRNNFAPDNPLQEKTSTRPIGFIQSHEDGCCGSCIWTVLLPLWDGSQCLGTRVLLPVVLELSLQLLPGEEYAALDGAQG